jgi:hypothetical protein
MTNVSSADIIKGAAISLAAAFLTFVVNTGTDAFSRHFDVTFQHAVILDKAGHLIQFDNPTSYSLDRATRLNCTTVTCPSSSTH